MARFLPDTRRLILAPFAGLSRGAAGRPANSPSALGGKARAPHRFKMGQETADTKSVAAPALRPGRAGCFSRRRSIEDGIRSDSRYFATVRRAMSTPSALSF